jgi:DNA-directed RNA polymerase subunit beta
MTRSHTERKRFRKSFGKIEEIAPMPNLIELQKSSYDNFLQINTPYELRQNSGLQEVFNSVFPVKDFSGRSQLEFVKYEFDTPKYDVEECQQRGMTYASPLKSTFRLVVWDVDNETGARSIRDIKEQDVYMGDMPLMTDKGTFVVNGTERVIVSQMHRSPGVFFDHDGGKTHSSGKYLFSARVIPYRGSWLDFEFDARDLVYVRIDRKRKILVTTLLMALDSMETEQKRLQAEKTGQALGDQQVQGMSREEILKSFYNQVIFKKVKKGWEVPFISEQWRGVKLAYPLIEAKTNTVLAAEGTKLSPKILRQLVSQGLESIILQDEDLHGRYCGADLINEETGEIYVEAGDELTKPLVSHLMELGIHEIPTLSIDHANVGPYIRNTLVADKNMSREESLIDIYKVLRPGEPPTINGAEALFKAQFFDAERYDLSAVGRVKMNARLNLKADDSCRVLRKEDILEILRVLVSLKDGRGEIDDIDNLGNRRVRSVGELLENQYRLGLSRMERTIRERMASLDVDTVMPHDLINAKPAASAIREFFASSQLSQFMDQTNPLSEITHKRRLSALGPGGLTRDRAGLEVRDVHPTHYGRICPIETPEGPNIGLINSLATYARVNSYGFIESPYRRVLNSQVTNEIVYLTAMEEGRYTIAQANAEVDKENRLLSDFVSCRRGNDFVMAQPSEIDFIDVSPKQLVSVAAALIPFLENDDANRSLMGSNMQRQAVPLVRVEAPLVGTGMERIVARDSGVTVIAKHDGVVDQVDSTRIVVRSTEPSDQSVGVDIYKLLKFQRSNHSTCINQRPLVKVGDTVKAGDIIADGPSTELGELALGGNALVAFLPWNGYNFEDSIIISERIARDDVFTSIHIEEFEVMARDTKLGNEEITRDIPNVGEESLRNLDEAGIVHIGASVNPGDILVGKVTPKGESPMTPEEKLLRAIFGEKASDVRDSSLRLPPGFSGTVVEVRVFSRRGIDKDERAVAIERAEIGRIEKDRDSERAILENNFYTRLRETLQDQQVSKGPAGVKSGTVLSTELLDNLTRPQLRQLVVQDEDVAEKVDLLKKQIDSEIDLLKARFEEKVDKLKRGDELSPGVMKMVKVFVAVKRKLQPGDKMAGRHGNKGVVSTIVPLEDMPHLEDGTPVDVVLSPLGLPSRMNIGQILETNLGWAAAGLGKQIGYLLEEMEAQQKKMKDLRELLKKIYESDLDKKDIDQMPDEELLEMAGNLKRGVPMATPVFDGAHEADIVRYLEMAGLGSSGQVVLIDGRTGEPFERKITVGQMYMLKLHHLVDDKIHARSIGPYSLVTQQPLGGKAQFGGQRFGEMEVWALQAYGAAYTLQEMLTVKSDDVAGRTKVFESIVRGGDSGFEAGVPESFKVLLKELRSLALSMDFEQKNLK